MLLPSHVKLLFPHTCHENWQIVHCTHKNWQRSFWKIFLYTYWGVSVSRQQMSPQNWELALHTQLFLSFDISAARLLENLAFHVQMFTEFWRPPPKGPSSFVALQITSHRDWSMSWRSPSIGRINGGRWRHDPLRLAHVHANKGSEAQPCKEHFGQQHPLERPGLPHRAVFNGSHRSGSPRHLFRAGVC